MKFLKISVLVIVCLLSKAALAKTTSSVVSVTGEVVGPTCSINNGTGLDQTIDMGTYSVSEVTTGSGSPVDVPILIDCSSSPVRSRGIRLDVKNIHDLTSQPGILKTSLNGVFIRLKWREDNTLVYRSKYFNNVTGNELYNASIIANVIGISPIPVAKGSFRSKLVLSVEYI
ncbi:fimbrial protein [Vibrio splendidus]|uniref:fimbrial protein n=1 Tax=Vibrio splendidus TaxID=29497 RepID=UPI00076AAD2A|nr:fimbrial protein [Vibrio splendidus]PHX03496.1 hypothetical protein VSPL_50780 [Vibrio splendidus]